MNYASLKECIDDLERAGHLIRVREQTDPFLEMALIQRRVYEAGGPALLFERVRGSSFPAVSNLYGSTERVRFIFRKTLRHVKKLIRIRADPAELFRSPLQSARMPGILLHALARKVRTGPILDQKIEWKDIPAIQGWPRDGGPFITLPQVYSEDPSKPGIFKSNLGMYRVQMSGNRYKAGHEIGMHYQIHRGIGVHHSRALKNKEDLRVSIFIGGPPAHAFAAVMPLPEGLPEIMFAGALAGRRFRYIRHNGHILSADADFCITGRIGKRTLPEGPFGDHLGYYSLTHDFPVMKIDAVYSRRDAIWPFTSVGRPPQEDTGFGALIHELAGPMAPASIPGLKSLHAVDAAGVHPLLLAVGSERYVPYAKRKPQELLTIANALLGFGQVSLAKYLFIIACEDQPQPDINNIPQFLAHLLQRMDFARDLHFQTCTTMDTLDYSGSGLNEGSKVIFAAAGSRKRTLSRQLPSNLSPPTPLRDMKIIIPGIVAIEGPRFSSYPAARRSIKKLENFLLKKSTAISGLPLWILCDDAKFTAQTLNNFLWVAFTRSDPARDIYGAGSFIKDKHWGCAGPLIIDARHKPFHAQPLQDDPEIVRRVEQLAAPGKSLHGIF